MAKVQDVVMAVLPGHIHMDAFQLVKTTKNSDLPISYTPAISPIFGNNPAFKVYSYDAKNLKLTDFSTYYLPISNDTGWQKEYSFNQVYQPHCKNCLLVNGMKNIMPANSLAQAYKQYYAVGNNAQPITQRNDWMPYYWCNVWEISGSGYKQCVRQAAVV